MVTIKQHNKIISGKATYKEIMNAIREIPLNLPLPTKGGDVKHSTYRITLEADLQKKKLTLERLIKECQEKNHIPANSPN